MLPWISNPPLYLLLLLYIIIFKIFVIWCLSSFLDTMFLEGREWDKEVIFMTYSVSGTRWGILPMLSHSESVSFVFGSFCIWVCGRKGEKKGRHRGRVRRGRSLSLCVKASFSKLPVETRLSCVEEPKENWTRNPKPDWSPGQPTAAHCLTLDQSHYIPGLVFSL